MSEHIIFTNKEILDFAENNLVFNKNDAGELTLVHVNCDVKSVHGDVGRVFGDVKAVYGDVKFVYGDVDAVSGDVGCLVGNIKTRRVI